MAVLKIPLEINDRGLFEKTRTQDDYMRSRLRIFLQSGASKFHILPSPGIASLWIQLTGIGPSTKFRSKSVYPENERKKLEYKIKTEANIWLEQGSEIIDVNIVGDETLPNGIQFITNNVRYSFHFVFVMPGKRRHQNAIGNWSIEEKVDVIY